MNHLGGLDFAGRVADGVGPIAVELGALGQSLKGCGFGLEAAGELAPLNGEEPGALDLGSGDGVGHVPCAADAQSKAFLPQGVNP